MTPTTESAYGEQNASCIEVGQSTTQSRPERPKESYMKQTNRWIITAAITLSSLAAAGHLQAKERVISHDELMDKLFGF